MVIPTDKPFTVEGRAGVYLYRVDNDTLYDITDPDNWQVKCDGRAECDELTCIVRNQAKLTFHLLNGSCMPTKLFSAMSTDEKIMHIKACVKEARLDCANDGIANTEVLDFFDYWVPWLVDEIKTLRNGAAHAIPLIDAAVVWQRDCTCGIGRNCEPCKALRYATTGTLI